MLLALYKDCFYVGYDRLYARVKWWLKSCPKTLRHNTQTIRESLKKWGQSTVHLGKLSAWKRAAQPLNLKGSVTGGCLWMDSFDVPLEGRGRTSRKAPEWSYKLNGPGQRFMALQDATGRVRALWGGYSPKIYDGEFLKVQREWMESHLAGATVLADNHFEWGKQRLHGVKFVTNIKRRTGSTATGERMTTLTKDEQDYNSALSSARARVEGGIGRLKTPFDALKRSFQEGEEQQNCLLWIAVGIENSRHR